MPPGIVRPYLFAVCLLLAAANVLTLPLRVPASALGPIFLGDFAVPGCVILWMNVMVRGDHGRFGRLLGVVLDDDLKLPLWAGMMLACGILVALAALAIYERRPADFRPFAAALAISAAAMSQLRRIEPSG